MLLSSLRLLLLAPIDLAAADRAPVPKDDSFHECLTLHPLPDGKLSVLFEFTTLFSGGNSDPPASIPQSHHSLTPPSLSLPLEQNNISELTISFVAGRWDQGRSSESGPLHYQSSGGGGEVRGWLLDDVAQGKPKNERWTAVTHALGGLFCAGLGPSDDGEGVTSFGGIYPPVRGSAKGRNHYFLSHPHTHLCTENLTPFLSLLPSKGLSGLSSLLAQPGIVFSWGFKAEGIEVIMPSHHNGGQGRWRGWWEGVVDLVPAKGGKRDFSLESLFKKRVPRAFPEAESSILRLIMPDKNVIAEPHGVSNERWVDGKRREVVEWDLFDDSLLGKDINFRWDGEDRFYYPRTITPPNIAITRTVTHPHASDGTFEIRISNHGNISREAVYSEIWPWWVKGWMSEISVHPEGEVDERRDLVTSISYNSSTPPSVSTTTIHCSLTLPARGTVILSIPFTKLTLKYTEHRPDAERGVEIPSGVLTLLDLVGESQIDNSDPHVENPLKTGRRRIYSPRLLLDVPTPDFSMPYNVIIMSSTVMAVFFGLMQGTLTRRWGWVELPKAIAKGDQGHVSVDGEVGQYSKLEHVEKS